MSIAPCQSLFVAPCSHVWHYKCIRPILIGHTWPNFLCPNCRAVADLEADVEDVQDWDDDREIEEAIEASRKESFASAEQDGEESEEQSMEDAAEHPSPSTEVRVNRAARNEAAVERKSPGASLELHLTARNREPSDDAISLGRSEHDSDREISGMERQLIERAQQLSLSDGADAPSSSSLSTPRPIPSRPGTARSQSSPETTQYALTPGNGPGGEGPMTPRNDAGPFVLDGGAGQQRGSRRGLPASSVAAAIEVAAANEETQA